MYVSNVLKRNNGNVTFSFWTSRELKAVFRVTVEWDTHSYSSIELSENIAEYWGEFLLYILQFIKN
jgi:hypothetical protein